MLWQGRKGSDNVEDRRGVSGGQVAVGGGILGVIALVLNLLLGGDGSNTQLPLPNQGQPMSTEQKAAQDQEAQFVSVVLKDLEDTWQQILAKEGKDYPKPTLVLFSGVTQSGCGNASAASGPFYCPADQKLYIDLSFYQELQERFHAPGDFAMAYVVAHEVGHHVQYLQGTFDKVAQLEQQSGGNKNKYSVAL